LDKLKRWYKDRVLPRIVFLPFWFMRIVSFPFGLFWEKKGKRAKTIQSMLCIEAGIRGWESIEFKELYASACEYLGSGRVHKLIINRDGNYFRQVKSALNCVHPTHYVYDSRTGSQKWSKGLYDSFKISFLFISRGITPIAILTDLPVRTWRMQCAVVTAKSGVVVSLMSPRMIYPIFPHGRIVAPSPLPLSQATMKYLNELSRTRQENKKPRAVFVGSLYEPRTSIIKEIREGLKARGLELEIKGRELGFGKTTDYDYWMNLINAEIVVTTADQVTSNATDWSWFPHMIYRYIEVTGCGSLLIASAVPGIQRFFTPGEHFIPFTSPSDAIDLIEYYLTNEEERKRIASQGHARVQTLVNARIYWTGIDIGLGKSSLT
jgi:hypothetical protein